MSIFRNQRVNHRIHIVGCGPRTGTTLITEMMTACFKIDQYAEHEASLFTRAKQKGNIYLTKHPGEIIVVGPMFALFSNLYVIYMLRDPRDTVTSKHKKAPDKYWSTMRYWNKYTRYGKRLETHPRFVTVRYEDLVQNPDEIQLQIMEKMPFLEKTADFSNYHQCATPSKGSLDALLGLRPVSASSIGKWRMHLPRIAGQLELHGKEKVAQSLIDYGYEADDAWLSELDGVEPDFSQSHWPEYFSREDLKKRMKGKYTEPMKAIFQSFNDKYFA